MIALGKGVLSTEKVEVNQAYLARIDERYFVVMPIDPTGAGRLAIPYVEADYIDPLDRKQRTFKHLHELHPIF